MLSQSLFRGDNEQLNSNTDSISIYFTRLLCARNCTSVCTYQPFLIALCMKSTVIIFLLRWRNTGMKCQVSMPTSHNQDAESGHLAQSPSPALSHYQMILPNKNNKVIIRLFSVVNKEIIRVNWLWLEREETPLERTLRDRDPGKVVSEGGNDLGRQLYRVR